MIARIFGSVTKFSVKVISGRVFFFYTQRFYRLAPALGASLLLALVLMLIFVPVSIHSNFSKQGLAGLLLLGNFGAYRYSGGDYFAPNPNPLIHLWSLSAEAQIYLALPLLLAVIFFIFSRLKFTFKLHNVIPILGILAYVVDQSLRIFPSFLNSFGINDVIGLRFYSPFFRFWEFAIGSSLFLLAKSSRGGSSNEGTSRNIFLVLSLCGLVFLPFYQFYFQTELTCLVTAAAIHFRSFSSIHSKLQKVGAWAGDRSYSIYLVHMPFLYCAIYSPVFETTRIQSLLGSILLSLIVGSLFYENIEVRFRPNKESRKSHVLFTQVFVVFALLPFLLFSFMRFAADNQYFGIDPNQRPPDYESSIDPRCYVSFDPCSFPEPNSKNQAILIGDSHAASLFQTFVESMKLAQVSAFVWQQNGCQFILKQSVTIEVAKQLGYDSPARNSKRTCFEHNQAIVDWVQVNPKTEVFVSQRSSSIKPKSIGSNEYQEVIYANLLFLKSLGVKLTVIGPNPEFPDGKQFFKGGLLLWQERYVPPKSFEETAMLKEPKNDHNFYLERLPFAEIDYIDSISPFCDQNTCTRWADSKWLYLDSDHLSVYGANRLEKAILEKVRGSQ